MFLPLQDARPLIGASGAVSGVVAAYLITCPRVRMWALFLHGTPLRVPACRAIGFWSALQLLSAFLGATRRWVGSPISAASSRVRSSSP